MDQAIRRYSSLFKLPSVRTIVCLLALFCIGSGVLSTMVLSPSIVGFASGLFLGATLIATSVALDFLSARIVLRGETIYNLRRTMALSLFGWLLWLTLIFTGDLVAAFFGASWWLRFCLLGFAAVVMFRLVVFGSTSAASYWRVLTSSMLQPLSCAVLFVSWWIFLANSLVWYSLLFFPVSMVVCALFVYVFLSSLNHVGKQTLGINSLTLLKAFMLNWVLGLNAPFEELLEKLGEAKDVQVSLIRFGASRPKAVVAVPSVHPGPFRNIGSSLLPSLLKASLESNLDCVACVPHGLLGHEFDLASQFQNERVTTDTLTALRAMKSSEEVASPFVKVGNGLATACCQVFGKYVFVSFTLAPRTIEDLPHELGLFVDKQAQKHGLTACAIVNAHNSIDGEVEEQEALKSLENVVMECLSRVVSLEQAPFRVGAASLVPDEFSLEDGMGSGGVTVTVVETGGKKYAYVVVDGNNMVSGLREQILEAINPLGIDDGEVFTTDTHSVSALVLNRRGYHPIGEVIDTARLIEYIKKATLAALSNLERSKMACRNITVAGVKVIGERQLEALCLLIDRVIGRAKKIVLPVFSAGGLVLMLLLLLV